MDHSDYRQTVLVLSDPPGMKVYDGERFVGITPNYMRVRRRHHASINMETPEGGRKNVPLNTHYRWGDSFGMNLLFYTFAPVGWITDLATGMAWRMDDPPLQRFGDSHRWPLKRTPTHVAVAPPQGVDPETSDALGMVIDERLREGEKFQVQDYQESAPLFKFYHSHHGLTENKNNRYLLYWHLRSDFILQSTAEKHQDGFTVKSELKDVITGDTYSRYSWQITPGTQDLRDRFTAKTLFHEYFHILPNTVFLNFANYEPKIMSAGIEQKGKDAPSNNLEDEVSRYLSAISIVRLEREQFHTIGHWTLDFVPAFVASHRNIIFPRYVGVTDTEFRRWYVSAGYGVEGGYMGRYGFLYLDLIPSVVWSQINYESPRVHGKVDSTTGQLLVEAGYSYFLTDHLVGRVYFRSMSEDADLWDRALSEASASPTITNSVTSGFAGISIGYYFPPSLQRREGWLVHRRTR